MAESDLDYALVTGRFALAVADSDDPGDNPDVIYCNQGTVEFTPLITFEKVAEGTPWPFEAGHSVFVAEISDDDYVDPTVVGVDRTGARDGAGHLTWRGKPFIKLIDLTSSKINPNISDPAKATHSVAFKNVKAVIDGTPVNVNFPARPGRFTKDGPDGDGKNDLIRVLPVVTGSSTPITVGPRGISIVSAAVSPEGELLFTFSDDTEQSAGELPGTAEAIEAATTATAAADTATTKAGEASTAATDATTAKDDAEVAKADAETAKVDAQTAKSDAEAARADLLGQKAQPSGIAPLDGSSKVPTTHLPVSTTTAVGAVELATNTEATTGTDTQRAVTPAGVKAVVDPIRDLSDATFANNLTASMAQAIAIKSGSAWTTGTVYKRGQIVVNPSGAVVMANANHTAAASYATDAAKWDAVTAATLGLAPDNGKRPVGKDELFINVKDYGAKGDGATDDTAAIQAAITASGWPATRATIFFPPGVYMVSSAISIDGAGANSTPNLDLLGYGATLKTSTGGITMVDITNSVVSNTRVRLRGFQMFCNAASTAVRLNNSEFCILSDIDFLGSFSTSVDIAGTSTYNTLVGCTFSNVARGLKISGTGSYLGVVNCHFGEQTSGSPLNWVQADTVQSVGIKFTGCTFYGEGNTLPAVNIVQGYSWTFTGCHFAYCSDVALFIGSDGVSYGHTVTGCTFDHNSKDDIKINGGRLNSIVGCIFNVRKVGTPASTYYNVEILNTFGGAAGSDNSVVGCTSRDTGTALAASFFAHASCQNVAFIANQYSIAPSNANTSALVVGRDGVQFPAGKTVTKGGVGMPEVLGRVTSIDAKTVGATTIYTVPTGKTAVITGWVVQSGAVTAITAGPTVGLGIAAGEDDIYAPVALTGLTSNLKTYVYNSVGLQASAPAGSVIKLGIDTASTGTAQVIHVTLLGYLL